MSYRKLTIGNETWEYVIGLHGVRIRRKNKSIWVKNIC